MRGMERAVGKVAAGLLVAIGCGSSAFATEITDVPTSFTRNSITVTLKAQPYPFPQNGYGAYEFRLRNNSSGAFNNARFRAYLRTPGAMFVRGGVPVEPERATCEFLSDTSVDCLIGTGDIPAAGETSFNFQVKTPTGASQLEMDWNVRSGLGSENFLVDPTAPSTTALSAEPTTGPTAKIATAIPPDGLFVYTGTGIDNRPGLNDHATAARVSPKFGTLIITSITEGTAALPNGVCNDPALVNLPAKYCSKLSVETGDGAKAVFDPFNPANSTLSEKLTIVLRIAAADVAGLNINQALIYYVPDDPNATPGFLPNCNKRSSSYVPVEGNDPCISSRTVLSKKFGDLAGIWEIVIFAKGNGRFGIW